MARCARLHIVNDTAEDVLLPLDEGVWRLNGAFEPDGYYACDQSCLLPTGYDVFTQVTFNYCDRAVKAFALSEIDGFDWTVEDGTVSLALRESFDVSPWVPEKGRVRLMSGAGLSVYAVDVKRTQYGGNYIYAAVCNDSNESLSYKITWAGCNGGTFEWPDNVSGELAPGCGKMVEFYGFEIENEEDIESIGLEAYVWQTEDELPAKYAMTLTLAAPLSYNGEEDVTADLGAATVETALLEQVRNVYVTFGACEQDGVAENGAEPIEWRVVTTDGETAPLLSRDILAARPFQAVDTSWENSTLKPWLNGEFLETAFTGEEQAKLAERDGCRVTLLTAEEAEMYFADDEARRCLTGNADAPCRTPACKTSCQCCAK